MSRHLAVLAALLVVLSGNAQQLKPLPDMTSAKVSSAKGAEGIILKQIMTDSHDGLSSTESIIAKFAFTLGRDAMPLGKKGDRVWQVHRVTFAETTSIWWVNAETGAVRGIFPEGKPNAEPPARAR